jgi:hypothetical protein
MSHRPLPTFVLLLRLLGLPRIAGELCRMIRAAYTNALPGLEFCRRVILAV